MTANRIVLLASILLCGASGVYACSFPEATFAVLDGDDAAIPEGGTDASPPPSPEASLPGDVDPNGTKEEAGVRDDASVKIEAGADGGGCVGTACDCDNDGVMNSGCGGLDCDDFDGLIRPTQTKLIEEPWSSLHTPAGDWNCNGTVVKRFNYNQTCPLLTGDCTEGFAGDPACGTSGTYNFCKSVILVGCMLDHSEQRTQACN